MSYTVKNGTAAPIILNQFEGASYYIGAGEELEVESHRAALTLEDFGATLTPDTKHSAIRAEDKRIAERDGDGFTTTDDLAPGEDDGNVEPGIDTHVEGDEGAALGEGVLVDGDPAHEDPESVVETPAPAKARTGK